MAPAIQATAGILRIAESQRRRRRAFLAGLAVLLVISVFLAVGSGAMAITPGQVAAILGDRAGIALPWAFEPAQESVLLAIRLPRAVLGLLVGASLAAAGAALQGLFRNPLADPGLIGVSTGAALAAALAIVLGGTAAAVLPESLMRVLVPLAAFAGGLTATFLVYRIARRGGRTDVATMLLAGVALNAIAGAGIGLLIFASTDQELRDLNFWLLGSLAGATWDRLALAGPLMGIPLVLFPAAARPLNALLMGEREAGHLGHPIDSVKRRLISLAALAVGAAVALTGVIGFVGLVVPHIVRLAVGPDHRVLLPASMLLGASLLLVADLLARTLVVPAELPIGILTSCVGGPFFLWLIMRRNALGGWR